MIRKQPLGPSAQRRLRHETKILQRLSGVEGVVQLGTAAPQHPGAIMLTDAGDTCLADLATPVDVDELVRLSMGMARAVAGMHSRGVVHRDISPTNIVLSDEARTPCLIDFSLATTFAELRPGFTHHTEIVGTLPYLAPEQTGRTGRPVDQRADLYALGASLYELATGAPPFGTGDPLRLTHDILARIPTPPAEVNPDVPAALSEIIMHLLEKEPDNRYQTADGLVHDVTRLREGAVELQIGAHDFPARALAPSRLIGRDDEIAQLTSAFAEASAGRSRGVLVSGAPGVGKTSLIDELRPVVTAADGWFVSGKFDQYRRDQEFDGVRQAFRALGRLLLAEPEEELADIRRRLLQELGANAGLMTAVVPEFATLLKVPPDPGDPLTAQVRAQRNAVKILRVVASHKRPVVFFVDDLQWAGRTPLGFMDAVCSGEADVQGLLLVGAYRHSEVDATHPLAPMLARWGRQRAGPLWVHLHNLPAVPLTTMVADMLRLDDARATELAAEVAPYTKGNPYDTVELLNALRHERLLRRAAGGWSWEAAALHHRFDRAYVADSVAKRVDAMPAATRDLLKTMACLSGRVEVSLLQVATALPLATVEHHLAAALDDGLLVMEPGAGEGDAVRFRHDRVRESVLQHLGPRARRQLRLARRLAARPELFAVAAEQYLPVADAVHDPQERRRMVQLFRQAADEAKLLSNYPVMEKLLAPAAALIDPADTATLVETLTDRHVALFSLGRLDEADEIYRSVVELCTDPMQRTGVTLVQVSSLTNRNRHREAIDLGVEQLRRLGLGVPEHDQLDAEIEQDLRVLYRWVDGGSAADDLARPQITDRVLLAIGAVVNRLMPVAFYSDHTMLAWLTLAALRMWVEHGPGRTLVGPAGHIGCVTIERRQDYRTGYESLRRILEVARVHRYEPETSQARFLHTVSTCHWFEPLEQAVREGERAQEGLIQGGDIQNACYSQQVTMFELIDCAPTLDEYAMAVDAALAFAQRMGNEQNVELSLFYRQMVRALRGGADISPTEGDTVPETLYSNPLAVIYLHITQATAAAIFGDQTQLLRHTEAAMSRLSNIAGHYQTAVMHLLRALALAEQIRTTTPGGRGPLLEELDAAIEWLTQRAADAPVNFLHLLRLMEAERAWAVGNFRSAAYAFDSARREVAGRQRPWHRALITERTARFYLAHGMELAGYELLAQTKQAYLAWGATAKINQLDWAYPTLQGSRDAAAAPRAEELATHRSSIMTGTIDLLGVVAASQALSSETTIDGLRAHVVEVLSAMTGATGVHLLLWNDEQHRWLQPTPGGGMTPATEPGHGHELPLSVIRYAERTREPLAVADATRDNRFARDPYLVDLDCCSILAVPILNRGALRALLLLENRLIRGAFSTERLDSIMLIAGQLAVSLDNALVYASLERKVTERTQQLARANDRLQQLSITDPLTGLANRRHLESVLASQWQRAQQHHRSLALAMIDIDHFKLYNDHYGHAAGDKCLHRVATELCAHVRHADLAARYGGEEFAIVMPDTDTSLAIRIAERLRHAVVALAEPHALDAAGIVTISIGVAAAIPEPDATVDRLVEQADVELYRAKHAGRNRVSGAGPARARH